MTLRGSVCSDVTMQALGSKIARQLQPGDGVFLLGQLGAGKTTLTRGMLRAWGYQGTVSSPTYAMVEEYVMDAFTLYHFDGYRLQDPDAWLQMGIDDYWRDDAICVIEWPESGYEVLPSPQLVVDISLQATGRGITLTGPVVNETPFKMAIEEFLQC